MRGLLLSLLPCLTVPLLLNLDPTKIDHLNEHLPPEFVQQLEHLGVAQCLTKGRKSPINVNLGNTTIVSYPPLRFENYESREEVMESEKNNVTATIVGYNNWKNRPTLSGGPLRGEYQLMEVSWDMYDITISGFGFHYGHTVNNAKYDFELHFVHTLHGLPIEQAKELPQGVVIVATFISEIMMSSMEMLELYNSTILSEDLFMIPNTTMTSFEWVPPDQFFPEDKQVYYTYNGTLSQPPCDGDVLWILMPDAIKMSRVEMMGYLHAARKPGGFTMFQLNSKSILDTEREVFLNIPSKLTPEATQFVQHNHGHSEVLGGIGAAFGALIVAILVLTVVYRHYVLKQKTLDVNFNVGFDNVNFLSRTA